MGAKAELTRCVTQAGYEVASEGGHKNLSKNALVFRSSHTQNPSRMKNSMFLTGLLVQMKAKKKKVTVIQMRKRIVARRRMTSRITVARIALIRIR